MVLLMSTILVTVDALRADHLGQYGYSRETMPVLDDLLDEGATTFTAAYANGTYTGISLPSILTSRYRGDEYVRSGPTVASALPDDVATAAIHSNTFFASKFDDVHGTDTYEDFYGESAHGEDVSAANRLSRRVFDAVRPMVQRAGLMDLARTIQEAVLPASLIHEVAIYESAETTTDRALEWLAGVDGDFFLWVHYMEPHRPYGVNVDDPAFGEALDRSSILDLMAEAGINPDRITDEQRRRLVDLYDSDLVYTSEHVARLFDWLRAEGRWNDTDVILTADHGEEFGEHGYYFHRNRPYDELLHVPLVVKSDRGDGGTIDEQRELLDVAPTICASHGVDPPATFLGRDLFESGPRDVVATGSFRDDGPVVASRGDGWKYIHVGGDGGGEELYDLAADPGERRNVAADNPDVAEVRRGAISEDLFHGDGASGVPDAEDVSDDVEQRLEGLGYLE
jgi:arylsulfatase A-like enzyme